MDDGIRVRVICGEITEMKARLCTEIVADPEYLDMWVPPGNGAFSHPSNPARPSLPTFSRVQALSETPRSHRSFDVEGAKYRDPMNPLQIGNARIWSCSIDGDEMTRCRPGKRGLRFLLVSGRPIKSRWPGSGPIVMNTQEELKQAYSELRNGTFIQPG